jgi:hypothetical protein
MIDDLIRQVALLQRQVDGTIKPEVSRAIVAPFLALPGLVGFWPMSSVQRSTGNVYDLSGQGRTLTYNGNPTFNYTGLVPYANLDGTGDYFSRADESDLDILGTETIYNSTVRGLTLGGWFYVSSSNGVILSKFTSGTGWYIQADGGSYRFGLSNNGGITTYAVTNTVLTNTARWYWMVGRFIPSSSISMRIDSTIVTNSTSIPASIANNAGSFQISGIGGASQLLTGRASLCFLCANALSDAIISSLFEQTRGVFGV